MAQHPFLRSIRPVNLLSFGPNTKKIELQPLNIMIGPNGSGKSNFIEIIGLLRELPDKDPWSTVLETGGVDEWIWKGVTKSDWTASAPPSIEIGYRSFDGIGVRNYKIDLAKNPATFSFQVRSEAMWTEVPQDHRRQIYVNRPASSPDSASIYVGTSATSKAHVLEVEQSLLAQLVDPFNYEELFYLGQKLSKIQLYRDWIFGVDANPRDPQPVGLGSGNLDEDLRNLAQVLKAWRDRGEETAFDRLRDLMRQFYGSVKDVDAELVGTHIRVVVKESTGFNTPAVRLSDGTLRWLALLIILLNPTPPPVVCIEEPELGLHPDAIHILADLLIEASKRTQLIVTTHSDTLLDAFTDTPEVVCICEKVEGSTVIQRLDKRHLKVWLKEYSLGKLWMSGEIGGNRW